MSLHMLVSTLFFISLLAFTVLFYGTLFMSQEKWSSLMADDNKHSALNRAFDTLVVTSVLLGVLTIVTGVVR